MTNIISINNLSLNNIKFCDLVINHHNDSLIRIIPILDKNNKEILVETDYISRDSIYINQDPNKQYIVKSYTYDYNQNLNNLNKFKSSIIDKIKYITTIPISDIKDNKTRFTINTHKDIDNKYILKDFLHYDNCKTSISVKLLKIILSKCECKLLIKIKGLLLTSKHTYLKLQIMKIYPESIDNLDIIHKTKILKLLHSKIYENINSLKKIGRYTIKKYSSKKNVKDELVSLLC